VVAYLSVMLCLASVLVALYYCPSCSTLFADWQSQVQVGQYSRAGIFLDGLNGCLDNGTIIFDGGDEINFTGEFNRKEEATSFNLGDYPGLLVEPEDSVRFKATSILKLRIVTLLQIRSICVEDQLYAQVSLWFVSYYSYQLNLQYSSHVHLTYLST
jgi:hypothetical protein